MKKAIRYKTGFWFSTFFKWSSFFERNLAQEHEPSLAAHGRLKYQCKVELLFSFPIGSALHSTGRRVADGLGSNTLGVNLPIPEVGMTFRNGC